METILVNGAEIPPAAVAAEMQYGRKQIIHTLRRGTHKQQLGLEHQERCFDHIEQ